MIRIDTPRRCTAVQAVSRGCIEAYCLKPFNKKTIRGGAVGPFLRQFSRMYRAITVTLPCG